MFVLKARAERIECPVPANRLCLAVSATLEAIRALLPPLARNAGNRAANH